MKRRLTTNEVALYDVVPPGRASKVRLVSVTFLPGGFDGMTIWTLILLKAELAEDDHSTLLAHELTHVAQMAEDGVVGFSTRYLADFARGLRKHRRWKPAYRDIGYEIEARAAAADWRQRNFHQAPDQRAR